MEAPEGDFLGKIEREKVKERGKLDFIAKEKIKNLSELFVLVVRSWNSWAFSCIWLMG